jgi:serine/threonine-protein kinase RsbW
MQDRIRINCSRQNLQQVRDFVRGFLLEAKRSDLQVNQVVLAVDEVVANFIIHANGEDASQFLDLLLVLAGPRLDIEIEDHSNNLFLPTSKVPNPDLRAYIQQGRKGGMGMALVSRIMDQVEFFERNSHTVCHLSKVLT